MTRKAHQLEISQTSTRPQSVIFFDTETVVTARSPNDNVHTLKLGYAMHYRLQADRKLRLMSDVKFTRAQELVEFINRICRGKTLTYVTAHNVTFDMTVCGLFNRLPDAGWTLSSFYTKGLVSLYRWKKGTAKLVFIDNTNLFPGTLKRWGDILGLPKLEVDFDTVSDKDLLTYCKRDVEIMVRCWQTWLDFLDRGDCGDFKPTTASTAMNVWRHRFMHVKVHIHNNEKVIDLEREAYHGGRCECFYQGDAGPGTYYYLDVNNMYGHVLRRYQYPYNLYGYAENQTVSMLIRRLEKYAVIAHVDMCVSKPFVPVKVGVHTAYPLGYFDAVLSTPELFYALRNGFIQNVRAMSWYRQDSLFMDFIDYFGKLRNRYKASHNDGFSEICKLLINSLYGKFGQRGLKQSRIGSCDLEEIESMSVYDVDKQEFYRLFKFAGSVFKERHDGESYNSFPGIAAHVTAFARMYLWCLIEKVPFRHVYYCDTDSLIVDAVGYEILKPLVVPGVIGMLKTELTASSLIIRAPKDYTMGERNRIKGIRQGAIPIHTSSFSQQQWFGLHGMIGLNSLEGVHVKTITKHLNRIIYSGTVGTEGWIEPFHLGSGSLAPVSIPHLLAFET